MPVLALAWVPQMLALGLELVLVLVLVPGALRLPVAITPRAAREASMRRLGMRWGRVGSKNSEPVHHLDNGHRADADVAAMQARPSPPTVLAPQAMLQVLAQRTVKARGRLASALVAPRPCAWCLTVMWWRCMTRAVGGCKRETVVWSSHPHRRPTQLYGR